MRFLAILVLLSALGIAGCAAYFSIIGLKLLFVGGGLSIVIMGISLEIGKIVTVTFLHQMWHKISTALKSYLIIATIFLIVITSIGIYGYLSAGYNATSIQVQEYERQIGFNNQKIINIENEIKTSPTTFHATEISLLNVNRENFIQQRLNIISQREAQINELRRDQSSVNIAAVDAGAAKSALDLARSVLDSDVDKELEQIRIYNSRLEILDSEVQSWINQGRGNIFRQSGIEKAREVRNAQEVERQQIENQIKNSQSRIDDLRKKYDEQVKEYNDRISLIESRTSSQQSQTNNNTKNIENEIAGLLLAIENYNKETDQNISQLNINSNNQQEQIKRENEENQNTIQSLYTENSELQQKIIKTDVGTFRFIAQSLNLKLDKTVNYFIWLIMIVFDPLAVALILCFNYLIVSSKPKAEKIKIDEQLNQNKLSTKVPVNISTVNVEPKLTNEIIFKSAPATEPIVEQLETFTPIVVDLPEKKEIPIKEPEFFASKKTNEPTNTPATILENPTGLREYEKYHTPSKPV